MNGFAHDAAALIRAGHVTPRDPAGSVAYGANDLHGHVGYNPWDGYIFIGWPDLALLMGQPRVQDGACLRTTGQEGGSTDRVLATRPAGHTAQMEAS